MTQIHRMQAGPSVKTFSLTSKQVVIINTFITIASRLFPQLLTLRKLGQPVQLKMRRLIGKQLVTTGKELF